MAENPLEMPYFIQPSVNLSATEKKAAYEQILLHLRGILDGEHHVIAKMATINSILKIHLPYTYWAGFYCMYNGNLKVGPYQGTIGCTDIQMGKGVCGKAAQTLTTQIVADVTTLHEGDDHITCDPNSKSEIVVPVFNAEKELIAVLDLDSTLTHSFDAIDKEYLELIMKEHFEVEELAGGY